MVPHCSGNQVVYFVLIAILISCALRVGIVFKEHDWRRLRCECATQGNEELRQVIPRPPMAEKEAVATEKPGKNYNFTLGMAKFPTGSWVLPPELAPGFENVSHMDPSRFKLHIKVLTYDRIESLERCLNSLENALYDGDLVDIDIFVDHSHDDQHSAWTSKSERKVEASFELLKRVRNMPWSHGHRQIHYRSQNGGIQPQWLEAWWPESVNDFAFVVEDDMELSPMFYVYFKHLLATYYYNASNFNPKMYGVSFQRQYFVAGEGGQHMSFQDAPLLYQLVGTWGQFLMPIPWQQFRVWYDLRRYNESRQPVLEGLKTTQWWRNKGNKLWTPWIIKWAHAQQMYNLYPGFPGNLSLSTSHREVGTNFKKYRKADAELITVGDFDNPNSDWWKLPGMSDLKKRDFCNRPVETWMVAKSLQELKIMLDIIQKGNAVSLIMVPPGGYEFVRNWLCHIDGLKDVKNYILVVSNLTIADDLSSRGHAVYYVGEELNVVQAKPSQQYWDSFWTQSHFQVVLSVLVMGYDVVVSTPEKIWHKNPFKFLENSSFDVQATIFLQSISNSFLFIRSTAVTIPLWTRIVKSQSSALNSQEAAAILTSGPLSFRSLEVSPSSSVDKYNTTSGLPVELLEPGLSVEAMKERMVLAGLWKIDDYDLACTSVKC